MTYAIYRLNATEVSEQNAIILKHKTVIAKQLGLGEMMDVAEVTASAEAIKHACNLIENGIVSDNEFMAKHWEGHPQVELINL